MIGREKEVTAKGTARRLIEKIRILDIGNHTRRIEINTREHLEYAHWDRRKAIPPPL